MWLINCSAILLTYFYVIKETRSELISDENQAREFLVLRDEVLYNTSCISEDVIDMKITTENFTWENFTDPLLRRAFQLIEKENDIKKSFEKISHLEENKRNQKIWEEMRKIFLSTGVCIYHDADERETDGNCTMINRSEIYYKFSKIGNLEERKYYWIAWHNSVGEMRSIYNERMEIFKKLKIFPNYNEWWLYPYEEAVESISQDLERVWQEILPLYKQLHAFVRKRLIGVYGDQVINSSGPIPSHLLSLWTDIWWNIKDIALPYPENNLNIKEIMKKKNMKDFDLLKLAEDFYHSLELPYIDENFWNDTHFAENGNCRSYFHFSCKGEINGMTACVPISELNLHRIIGFVSDVYNANLEKRPDWPHMNNQLPNPAFLKALRYTGELSSWTIDYLNHTGFMKDIPTNLDKIEQDMNALMKVALRFLPTIPYTYKVTKWRWDSFDFLISNQDYNSKWWEYSLEYQGICPPVKRTEEHFDPASSQEVATNSPVIRDFIGIIYAFQFYKAACEEAGHNDLLHRCNLYGEKTFGDKIRRIVYFGKSLRGPEGISLMTNGESVSMDAKPLLDYFQPLYEWLKMQNKEETLGWKSSDPMQCP